MVVVFFCLRPETTVVVGDYCFKETSLSLVCYERVVEIVPAKSFGFLQNQHHRVWSLFPLAGAQSYTWLRATAFFWQPSHWSESASSSSSSSASSTGRRRSGTHTQGAVNLLSDGWMPHSLCEQLGDGQQQMGFPVPQRRTSTLFLFLHPSVHLTKPGRMFFSVLPARWISSLLSKYALRGKEAHFRLFCASPSRVVFIGKHRNLERGVTCSRWRRAHSWGRILFFKWQMHHFSS